MSQLENLKTLINCNYNELNLQVQKLQFYRNTSIAFAAFISLISLVISKSNTLSYNYFWILVFSFLAFSLYQFLTPLKIHLNYKNLPYSSNSLELHTKIFQELSHSIVENNKILKKVSKYVVKGGIITGVICIYGIVTILDLTAIFHSLFN